ncbi:MAG: nucleotidyltransferase domain-containing protein [Candidatus Woesearchaeota archaeon]
MITLLNNSYIKILELFYKNKYDAFHFRKIVRLTKLHEPSVFSILKKLEKENILISKKEGNLKKYFLKNSLNTYLIFELFDLNRYEKLPLIRKNAISIFLKTLDEKPHFVILFGSTAKETYKEDSDIDLLLIVNKSIKTEIAEKETDALTGLKISCFQINFKEFLKEIKLKKDKVVQSAINTGYPLINHIQYYEALNERN